MPSQSITDHKTEKKILILTFLSHPLRVEMTLILSPNCFFSFYKFFLLVVFCCLTQKKNVYITFSPDMMYLILVIFIYGFHMNMTLL